MNSLCDKLNYLVNAKLGGNWTELSRLTGIGISTLQPLKKGGNPRLDTIKRIAAALNVSIDWLASEDEEIGMEAGQQMALNNNSDSQKLALVGNSSKVAGSALVVPKQWGIDDSGVAYQVEDNSMMNSGITQSSFVIALPMAVVTQGCIALVKVFSTYAVRKYFKSSDERVTLMQDYPADSKVTFDQAESKDVQPVGPVLASIRFWMGQPALDTKFYNSGQKDYFPVADTKASIVGKVIKMLAESRMLRADEIAAALGNVTEQDVVEFMSAGNLSVLKQIDKIAMLLGTTAHVIYSVVDWAANNPEVLNSPDDVVEMCNKLSVMLDAYFTASSERREAVDDLLCKP